MRKLQFLNFLTIIALLHAQTISAYNLQGSYLNLDEQQVPYSNFEGKFLLVEAFATWCPHCQDEHEDLEQLWQNYNNSVQILSLSVASDDTLATVREFLIEYPTPWSIGLDIDGNFKNNYDISGFPTLLFFNSQGEVLSCHVGERSFADLSSDVDNIIIDEDAYKKDHDTSCELDPFVRFVQSPLFLILAFVGLTMIIFLVKKKITK